MGVRLAGRWQNGRKTNDNDHDLRYLKKAELVEDETVLKTKQETVKEMMMRMDETTMKTVAEMMQMLDAGDRIVQSGRRVLDRSRGELETPAYPLTMRPRPPPRPAVANGYSSLITERFAPKSISRWESQGAKGKIFRPSGGESPRRQSRARSPREG
jgi:hypothetical protein